MPFLTRFPGRSAFSLSALALSFMSLQACDTSPNADSEGAQGSSGVEGNHFDSYSEGGDLGNSPILPRQSYSSTVGSARLSSEDGIYVVDGRLQFDDPDVYVSFVRRSSEWSAKEREAWETSKGFESLASYSVADSSNSSARMEGGENIYMPDDVAGSFLNPKGQFGIGDRVYDIEGQEMVTSDLDGSVINSIPIDIPCEEYGCSGGGGGGGSTPPYPDNPSVDKGYGTLEVRQSTRDLYRYQGKGSIFRVHFFLYSSIGARTDNGTLRSGNFRGYYYQGLRPQSGVLDCKAYYSDTDSKRYAYNDFTFAEDDQSTIKAYFDQDVFDFTGTGTLEEIRCNHSLTSNRRVFGLGYQDDPNQSTSFSTSRYF